MVVVVANGAVVLMSDSAWLPDELASERKRGKSPLRCLLPFQARATIPVTIFAKIGRHTHAPESASCLRPERRRDSDTLCVVLGRLNGPPVSREQVLSRKFSEFLGDKRNFQSGSLAKATMTKSAPEKNARTEASQVAVGPQEIARE